MKKIIALIQIIITFALMMWVINRYIIKGPAEKILTNSCTVKEITTSDTLNDITLTDCDVGGTTFDLFYMNSSSNSSFSLNTVYIGYDVFLWYLVDTDGYSVLVQNDTSSCSYLFSLGENGDICSNRTSYVKEYAVELFEEFAEHLGFKSYTDLAEFFDEYIEDNYQE